METILGAAETDFEARSSSVLVTHTECGIRVDMIPSSAKVTRLDADAFLERRTIRSTYFSPSLCAERVVASVRAGGSPKVFRELFSQDDMTIVVFLRHYA